MSMNGPMTDDSSKLQRCTSILSQLKTTVLTYGEEK